MVRSGAIVWRTNKNLNTTSRGLGGQANPNSRILKIYWELGQIEIGLGTLVVTNEGIDGPVAQSIHSLKHWRKQTQPHILGDETPWVVKGVKQWLWIFANSDFP
jgi:transposase